MILETVEMWNKHTVDEDMFEGNSESQGAHIGVNYRDG